MTLNSAEQSYLAAQPLGRLATIAPDGSPQNKPVGFSWNADPGTIDIYGFGMEQSQKFRNVAGDPRVAFLVDDTAGTGASGTRFLEIRGLAETASGRATPEGGVSPQIIRIRPRRVISWNIDPHIPGLQARDISPGGERPDAT